MTVSGEIDVGGTGRRSQSQEVDLVDAADIWLAAFNEMAPPGETPLPREISHASLAPTATLKLIEPVRFGCPVTIEIFEAPAKPYLVSFFNRRRAIETWPDSGNAVLGSALTESPSRHTPPLTLRAE